MFGEKDNETYGTNGSSLHFKFREYNPLVARFFKPDQLAEMYTYNCPYTFAEGNIQILQNHIK